MVAAPASRATMLSASVNLSQTTTMANASSTAYSTPTTANLNPATSLFAVSLSRLTQRRTRMGPSMARTVGNPTRSKPESHRDWFWRNETMVLFPRQRSVGAT